MPTYDYHCDTCGRDFEAYRSFTDESVPKCPGREEGSCSSKGKGKVTKVLSVPAISFRGEGFYKNDSRTSSSAGKASSGDASSSKSDAAKPSTSKADSSDTSSSKDNKSTETKAAAPAKKSSSSDAA